MTTQRQAYGEAERRLVIAIDVGTTFSGCSYALLDPGRVPQIQPVTRFIGQREPRGDSKVPSIVCYDRNGKFVAAGAQTDTDLNPELLEMDGIVRVEWFKLHLRPPRLDPDQSFELEKLRSFPRNKTPVQVFGDMLRYLLQSTKQYITDSETWSWRSIERNVFFVLSHPNGWEGKQQSQMRRAAILGGMVQNDAEAAERVTFVTEGEASLHFCLNKVSSGYDKKGILIVDCGGGTIDVSAYSQSGLSTRSFKEITSSTCIFQGAIFVTCRAQEYFKRKLANSKYGTDQEIESITQTFDKLTKCAFDGPGGSHYVKFGGLRDNDTAFGIRSGSIKVPGTDMANFFEPSIKSIIKVVKEQCKISPVPIKTLFLVGGFARSNYLLSKLDETFDSHNVKILRADTTLLNKAVADGAVSYYIDHFVSTRVSKHTYGISMRVAYDATNPEHIRRSHLKVSNASGSQRIGGVFSPILSKGTSVSEETEFREDYYMELAPNSFKTWSSYTTDVISYCGSSPKAPYWIDLEPNCFPDVCSITADTTNVKKNLKLQYDGQQPYYKFTFDVVLLFGLTELKAQIAWKENGVEKRGPATIVYD